MSAQQTIQIIAGPTASGKSAFALKKAKELNGIIINADSMQIYNALPILTARPTEEEQQLCPHRLYAHLHPAEKCSARRWRDLAIEEIEKAFSKKQTPMIVGGTGLYIKALTEGLSPIPEVPDEIRKETMALQEKLGNPNFHEALAKKDPAMAQRLEPGDTQRLIRAYEVIEATGTSLVEWQKEPLEGPPENWTFEFHVILPERAVLHEKINKRLDEMIEEGTLDEVKELADMIERGEVPENAQIVKAHGFRPLRSYLRGEKSMEEALEGTKAEIRQYAKRQTTWLRHQTPADIP